MQIQPQSSTMQRVEHTKVLQQLTRILSGIPETRVPSASPRVGATSTSIDATAPRVIRTQRQVHQRHTRSNTPMPSIMEEDECADDDADDDATIVTSNSSNQQPRNPAPTPTASTRDLPAIISPHNPAPKQCTVHGHRIGSKRNNINTIKRKRLQQLIDQQTTADQQLLAKFPTTDSPSKSPTSIPINDDATFQPLVSYHMPTPKASKAPLIS